MARAIFFTLLLLFTVTIRHTANAARDPDFAEFEDDGEFDFDLPQDEDFDDDEMSVEDENGEVEDHEFDEDEEQLDEDSFESDLDSEEFERKKGGSPSNIEIAESTVQAKPFWKAYYMEMLVIAVMVLYLVSYFIGRTRNSSLAQQWLDANTNLLNEHFALVGDNGEGEDPTEGEIVHENDNVFKIWCSGRANCSGMLIHMRLCRRHDLFSMFTGLITPEYDTITIIFQLGEEDMDSFVVAVGQKKILQKMHKDYEDLSNFCSAPRPISKNKDERVFLLSEIGDASSTFLSDRVSTFLNKHPDTVESIHVSDQYTGFVQESDDSEVVVVRKPEKRIQFTFRASFVSGGGEDPHMKFALQLLDHVKSIRLNRDAREKAVRNRSKVAAQLDKLQHSQRQEAAQQRREEKKRAEKEKMLQENDPEKTRKWEEREARRERKKMQPKGKNVKVRTSM